MTKYAWSGNISDEIWRGGPCDSIEECVKEAIASGYEKGETIAVGIVEPYEVGYVDESLIIESLQLQAIDEVGELAEDWLGCITKKQQRDLGEKLFKTVTEWLEEINEKPTFYKVLPLSDVITIGGE